MVQTRSGVQDRRGYDPFLKLCLVIAATGLILLILMYWKIGLGLLMFGAVSFIVLEAVSAPPINGPRNFAVFSRMATRRRPVLVCLGDSLTHGTCSASITPLIPTKLCDALGMEPPEQKIFSDPLWVVNCGQNSITTHTILTERMSAAMGCYPDYVLLWIGSNDVRAMYKKSWATGVVSMNELPEVPSMETFERNLTGILNFLRQSSPKTQIGLCTLPPMGEDLKSRSNELVRQANEIIERVGKAHGEPCFLIPVYSHLEAKIEKKRGKGSLPVDYFFFAAVVMNTIYNLVPGVSWNTMSSTFFSHEVLSDGLHLNERGGDQVADLVVDWLMKNNIAKAIVVKS